jgi:predicted amidohydrolase
MTGRYQDLAYNLATHIRIMQETTAAGCHRVVFPELSVTGHNASAEDLRFIKPADGSIFRALTNQL